MLTLSRLLADLGGVTGVLSMGAAGAVQRRCSAAMQVERVSGLGVWLSGGWGSRQQASCCLGRDDVQACTYVLMLVGPAGGQIRLARWERDRCGLLPTTAVKHWARD